MKHAWLLLLLAACASNRRDELPLVQPTSTASPNRTVRIAADAKFSPGCVEIRPGETIEWSSDAPDVPINVTSLGDAVELFSPNLQPGLRCDPAAPTRVCWRHTFPRAGCFDYFDSNSGSPGRAVRDPYYGTVRYVGDGTDVTRGTVCVTATGSCPGVCCDTKFDCPTEPGTEYECRARRCVEAKSGAPTPCLIAQ